jgi:O-glycosyl hydrolase
MARKAAERALPWIISAWHPPGWMCADPAQDRWAHAREVPRENWPELIENVTSYLLAVREYAGREPDMFSFNEPDYGVMLHLTAEDHRDLTIALGRAFEAAGLSTKLLLGDVTNPRGTHTYCQPTAEDPQARQYLAAVGFHSWGGASADDYRAWRDLAESLELPLLVTEFGVDAAAWRTRSYDTYYYAMQEVGMMQDILTHARPRSTMQWELTADYSIVDEVAGQLVPGTRMRMLAHYYNLAPTPSRGVSAVSSHEAVRATAFVDENGAWSVHLTNHGAGREVTIGGLPPGQAVLARIDDSEGTRDIEDRPSPDGRLTVALPAQCICTVRGG